MHQTKVYNCERTEQYTLDGILWYNSIIELGVLENIKIILVNKSEFNKIPN
jgi:hypothetical protein